MSAPTLIVISDLHVGAPPLDNCDNELERHLVAFLEENLARRASPVELVINGDFLDFAQAPPWSGPQLESVSSTGIPLCFTEQQSLDKFRAIASAHPDIFQGLRSFLESQNGNTLTILPGNHDADLFWESVRAEFLTTVSATKASVESRLKFHLNSVYRPILFPDVWIEHGHQYDPCNRFTVEGQPCWSEQSPPIFKDKHGEMRLYECVGTRFLIKFLNHLDALYPFVGNIKPFSRFIRIFGVSALVPGYGPLKATVAVYAMLKFLSTTVTHRSSDLLGLNQPGKGPDQLWQQVLQKMSADDQQRFVEKFTKRGFQFDSDIPLSMYVNNPLHADALMLFLADNLDLLDDEPDKHPSLLSIGGQEGRLTLAKGFSVDETDELKKAAALALQSKGVKAIIMGHTHEPVDNSAELNYINTGSWTRYYQFTQEKELRSWSLLRERSFERFPYQLNYAEMVLGLSPAISKITFKP